MAKARVRYLSDDELRNKMTEFEKRYAMSSDEFYEKYQRGEMGDSADVVRWFAYCEMLRRPSGDLNQG